jgi:hypothetical protein
MRRIYESEALRRDDDDPFSPTEDGPEREHRTIRWDNFSHALLPLSFRRRAISVSIEADREVYARDQPVGFRVTLRNRLPFPVSIPTTSPVHWTWAVDGVDEASHVVERPTDGGLLQFRRSERKTFHRSWYQRFRESADEWSPAAPGEYTLSARLVVDSPEAAGLLAETTVRIE